MPSRLIVITSCVCSDGGGGVASSTFGGTSTSSPICRIGVATMKMISSTRTTSTSGVMLISERTPPPLLPPNPIKNLQHVSSHFSLCDLRAGLLIFGEDRHAGELRFVRG